MSGWDDEPLDECFDGIKAEGISASIKLDDEDLLSPVKLNLKSKKKPINFTFISDDKMQQLFNEILERAEGVIPGSLFDLKTEVLVKNRGSKDFRELLNALCEKGFSICHLYDQSSKYNSYYKGYYLKSSTYQIYKELSIKEEETSEDYIKRNMIRLRKAACNRDFPFQTLHAIRDKEKFIEELENEKIIVTEIRELNNYTSITFFREYRDEIVISR